MNVRRRVETFPQRRLLVLGDLILDRYVWGEVERISPEAPVPVVRVETESAMLGGAGNVARNVASLGGQVEMVSVTGDDDAANEIARLCEEWKIDVRGVVRDPDRPTTEKSRIIARAQQLVRFDRESEEPLGAARTDALLDALRDAAGRVEGVIVEDYGKGLLTPEVLGEMMSIFRAANLRVFIDPKELPWPYAGAELVKPNLREAEIVSGQRARSDADLDRIGRHLLDLCGAQVLAITRGSRGMTLYGVDDGDGSGRLQVPTTPRAVSDVAGAGDTAIATLALARLSGADWHEAATLANAASGVVVQVPGTATVRPEQLVAACGVGP